MADVDASLLYFCSLVSKHNKVALTGECADEIFGGYPWFYRDELLKTDGFPWSRDLETRTALLSPNFTKELRLDEYVRDRYLTDLVRVPRLDGEEPQDTRRREITYLCVRWFMQTLLDRMDRMSMYSGLEARVPYADHRIIEHVYNVPWIEIPQRHGKSLLRRHAGIYSRKRSAQKKSPYPKTYHPNYEYLLAREFEIS